MDVYFPCPVIGTGTAEDPRYIEPLPGEFYLCAKGIATGVFCWDTDGVYQPERTWWLNSQMALDLGFAAIGKFDVPDAEWERIRAALPEIDGVTGTVTSWANSPRELKQIARRGLSRVVTRLRARGFTIDELGDVEPALITVYNQVKVNWRPNGQAARRLWDEMVAHFDRLYDETKSTLAPTRFLNNYTVNVTAAQNFVNLVNDVDAVDDTVRVFDTLYLARVWTRLIAAVQD